MDQEMENLRKERDWLKQQLTYSEEQAAKRAVMIQSIGEGLIGTDAQGKIMFHTDEFLQLFGWKLGEKINDPLLQALLPVTDKGEPEELSTDPIQEVVETRNKVKRTFNFKDQRGEIVVFNLLFSPAFFNDQIFGVMVNFHDITTEKQMEQMKDAFFNASTHELRTPVTALRWISKKLLNKYAEGLSDEQKGLAQEFYDTSVHLSDLVDDMLQIARSNDMKVKTKAVSLQTYVPRIVEECQFTGEEHHVQVEIAELPEEKVVLDPKLFEHVLMNILSNAIKYSHEHGKVNVNVTGREQDWLFSVTDQGIGIPEKDHRLMFSRFFRATNALDSGKKGTGLGLYLVKLFVEKWGGQVWFESAENQGTQFFFTVPKGE